MIKVVYACNDKLFDGLFLSILSVARRCKEPIEFYLLTGDFINIDPDYVKLTNEHTEIINKMILSYNKNSSFTVIDCSSDFFKVFGQNNKNAYNRCSTYTLLRLLLNRYSCFKGKVIYLDTDTMACGDIKNLYNIDVSNCEFAVAHNSPVIRWYQSKNYFNAGVILFNMDQCRDTELFNKTQTLLNSKKVFNTDQMALYRSSINYIFFPGDEYRFNRQTNKIHKDDIIKHFVNQVIALPGRRLIKQWDVKKVKRKLKFTCFNEDYRIYKEMKDKILLTLKDEYFIRVSNLRKSYGTLKAVDGISFKVKKGSLFAFLGINGAGKSTTINIISSILSKDSGDITIDSYDLVKDNAKVKRLIGIVFQNSCLDVLLTVRENLESRARFYKMKKIEIETSINRVTKILKLGPILNQPVGKLSGGQRRRVDIARALIHEPKLLMLDEPTTGLDPKTRLDVWKLIDEVRQRTGMTVFLTTHYLEEADKASYIVIMDKGSIIAEGTPVELKDKYSNDVIIAYRDKNALFEKKISKYKYLYNEDANAYEIMIKNSSEAKEILKKYNSDIIDFEIKKGNMDSVFLNVTGEGKL